MSKTIINANASEINTSMNTWGIINSKFGEHSEFRIKMEELKIMSKNSSRPNYGVEIAAWNRKVKEWRKNIEDEIDYNCCPDIKMSLGTSIINIDLLGMAYSRINRKGYGDVKIYKTQVIEGISNSKKYLRKCK